MKQLKASIDLELRKQSDLTVAKLDKKIRALKDQVKSLSQSGVLSNLDEGSRERASGNQTHDNIKTDGDELAPKDQKNMTMTSGGFQLVKTEKDEEVADVDDDELTKMIVNEQLDIRLKGVLEDMEKLKEDQALL